MSADQKIEGGADDFVEEEETNSNLVMPTIESPTEETKKPHTKEVVKRYVRI